MGSKRVPKLITAEQTKFKFLDHPADVGFETYGSTLAEAFESSALALIWLVVESESVEEHDEKAIIVNASDREQLLVKFLSEILYLFDGEGFVVKRANIVEMDDRSLTATLRGERFDPKKHRTKLDVKAITYHQLTIEQRDSGFLLRVYVDV